MIIRTRSKKDCVWEQDQIFKNTFLRLNRIRYLISLYIFANFKSANYFAKFCKIFTSESMHILVHIDIF